ncbi:transcription factor E4F1 isoform X2 [Indicator indicator]|uniref:transcription factor E4F1 isoform X2 n=1 Tax=Indicator indicator TaxID=1002788 RepID=UPI0023DEB0CE|nr:transcription factor E4F1 isoform X2 [Indicator indicator]
MEAAMATNTGPAGLTAAAAEPREEAVAERSGSSAPSAGPAAFLSLPAPFSEEDEDDVHKCGRCQAEFTSLEEFVQHKLQKVCQRAPEALAAASAGLLKQEVQKVVPSVEESITVAHIVVEASSIAEEISNASAIVGSGHIKEVIVAGDQVFENPNGHIDGEAAEEQGHPGEQEQDASTELIKVKLLINKEGRYVCELCRKTFKTASILKAHMITHSSRKDYECKLCGTSFRTKGSLIRHHRCHTDERPYKCKKCGKSFRESGALTRHLKSLTPCTEKIRFNVNKEIVVNKDDLPTGSNAETVASIGSESIETSPVIHLMTDAKGNVLHEVHVQMQELPVVDAKSLGQDVTAHLPPLSPELPCEGEVNSENLLRQYCSRGFHEKGSLVRHIRRHTGEKPFKCYKCGRGFAEHGTLNRHLKTKGGCLLALKDVEEVIVSEESQSADNLAATVISEDPHTVLVEFSSVVADTQEYIIETATEDMETSEATEIIEGTRHEVDSHIMKVVQQIVNQANSGHQIIVQNVTVAENSEVSTDTADTITIATPESLTEQVAMTLASAIGEGAVLTTEGGIETEEATVTMVASEDIEIMEHAGELLIASQEGEVEVQTVIV